ncbi:MSCRAMM family protein, partial [Enterococcus faecium]|uniref:MSCRAMM family protein n=1 Tax=Enterococcus faecium TaxID=1352 RepID=UPI0023B2CBFB
MLTKEDIQTKEALAGATFELREKNGQLVKTKTPLTSNENGQIVIKKLCPGEYKFIEIRSPQGYQIEKRPVHFHVDFSQTVVSLTAYNKKQIKKEFPKTGEFNSYGLIMLGGVIIVFVLVIRLIYRLDRFLL